MIPGRFTRQIALVAAGAAIVGFGAAGCGSKAKEAPGTTAPAATTPPAAVTPTEKNVKPMPTVQDRGALDSGSCAPGQYKINGVCQ